VDINFKLTTAKEAKESSDSNFIYAVISTVNNAIKHGRNFVKIDVEFISAYKTANVVEILKNEGDDVNWIQEPSNKQLVISW